MYSNTNDQLQRGFYNVNPMFYCNYQPAQIFARGSPWNANFFNTWPVQEQYQSNYPFADFYFPPNSAPAAMTSPAVTGCSLPERTLGETPRIKAEHQPRARQEEPEQKRGLMAEDKRRQKFGRNIISNIFQMALKKMGSPDFSQYIVDGIRRNQLTISEEQFRGKLAEKSKLTSFYINSKEMKKLLVGNPIGTTKLDIHFRKLLRVLIRIYFHHYHVPYIYHSGKIKKESRDLHLRALRKLDQKITKLCP